MKRQRGRNRRSGGGGNNPNRHYESNGPDVKIRGSAQQVLEKYLQYAHYLNYNFVYFLILLFVQVNTYIDYYQPI